MAAAAAAAASPLKLDFPEVPPLRSMSSAARVSSIEIADGLAGSGW